jgi:hypothetical protein
MARFADGCVAIHVTLAAFPPVKPASTADLIPVAKAACAMLQLANR